MTSPILKWAGGKSWFAKSHGEDLREHVVDNGGRYIEPFLGGASMALYMKLDGMVLADIDEDLIRTYAAICDHTEEVAEYLGDLQTFTGEEAYYTVRSFEPDNDAEHAARILYLNKFCYNGLYRKNRKGEFNVPYGKDPDRKLPTLAQLKDVKKALGDCTLLAGSYQGVIEGASEGDTIYVDPPYDGTFADYSQQGFDESDQESLAEYLYEAWGRGADFFCHNSDTELVRELFDEWTTIIEIDEPRGIGKKAPCLLIMGVNE